jgi:SAM-dependent methyltransferase
MKESYDYKKSWQENYREHPWAEKGQGSETKIGEFASSMMEAFKRSGILDLVKKQEVSMLVSSVSTGEKDWEFLKQLDGHLGKLKKFHRPSVVLTDFTLTEEEKKSIIKKPEKEYENLDARIVACDSYHLPFKENEFQVLYERLGALWHAAEEDDKRHGEGALVQNILKEYKRVVEPGGKIIFDCASHVVSPLPTTVMIRQAVKRNVEGFLKELGFETKVVGKDEMFLVLTNPDSKSKKK